MNDSKFADKIGKAVIASILTASVVPTVTSNVVFAEDTTPKTEKTEKTKDSEKSNTESSEDASKAEEKDFKKAKAKTLDADQLKMDEEGKVYFQTKKDNETYKFCFDLLKTDLSSLADSGTEKTVTVYKGDKGIKDYPVKVTKSKIYFNEDFYKYVQDLDLFDLEQDSNAKDSYKYYLDISDFVKENSQKTYDDYDESYSFQIKNAVYVIQKGKPVTVDGKALPVGTLSKENYEKAAALLDSINAGSLSETEEQQKTKELLSILGVKTSTTNDAETADSYELIAVEKNSKIPIPSATFLHTKPDNTTETLKTDQNGQILIEQLEPGIHKFEQTEVPKGYKLNTTKYIVKVNDKNSIETVNNTTQKIMYRLEKADGTFDTYHMVLNENRKYGSEVSWSRPADGTYASASVNYTVDGAKTTAVDVKRKKNVLSVSELQDGQELGTRYSGFTWSGTINGEKVSGTGPFTETLNVGSKYDITIKAKEGYSLNGTMHLTGTIQSPDHSSGAKYTINSKTIQYTLSFDSQGGSKCDSKKLAFGATVGTLPTPTKKGYTFAGWYSDTESGYRLTEDVTMDSKNVTYYARWNPIKLKASFDTDGGKAIEDMTFDYDSTISLPTPEKEGYTFLGWTWNGQDTPKKGTVSHVTKENLKFTAHWEKKEDTSKDDSKDSSDSFDKDSTSVGSAIPSAVRLVKKLFNR